MLTREFRGKSKPKRDCNKIYIELEVDADANAKSCIK